ncbi:hypothetical protein LTS14_001265 [Recurvomyces mirabilis]|nr:hypothetical protein LTS14_001265 [Recurvomyces mirabilis]
MSRWVAYAVLGNILDILIVGFPVYLVWDLQMSSSKKITVVSGFVVRFVLLPISILRLLALSPALHNTNYLFASVEAGTWTQTEQCYAILSATTPCLRIFLSAAQTGLLNLEATSDGGGAYYANGSFSQPLSRSRDKRLRSTRIQGHGYGGLSGSAAMSGGGGSRHSIELATRQRGETSARVVGMGSRPGMRDDQVKSGDDRGSMASDSSERAIVVRQTIDVRVQNLDGSSVRSLGKGWKGMGR